MGKREAGSLGLSAVRRARLAERTEKLAQLGGWEWDLETGDLLWSDNHFRLFGLEPQEVVPSPEFVIEQTHIEDRQYVTATVAAALETGQFPVLEYRIHRRDGAIRHFRATLEIHERRAGRVRTMIGAVQDVTDRRRAEREIAAHIALADALAGWTSLRDGGHDLLRRLGASLGFTAGAFWIPEARELKATVFWSAPSIEAAELADATRATTLVHGLGLPGEAWSAGRPLELELDGTSASPRRDAALAAGFVSAIVVPAVQPPDVLAVLEFYSSEPGRLTRRLARSLGGIGYELGEFLSHRHGDLAPSPITPREREILQLAAHGLAGPEIASRLGIGPATVKSHFENLYAKLEVSDRATAVAAALREGLIE
ncbi:MAG: PAS domain-containing protein [Gaiellaceae bacterium]